MARYLRSTSSGAVLPFNEKLLRLTNVEELTPTEATAHEVSVGKVPAPKAKAKAKAKVAPKPVEAAAVAVADIADGEPSAEDVLAALELD